MQLNTIEKKNHSHQRAQPACKLLYKSQIDEDTHRDHVVVFLERLGVIHPRSRQYHLTARIGCRRHHWAYGTSLQSSADAGSARCCRS